MRDRNQSASGGAFAKKIINLATKAVIVEKEKVEDIFRNFANQNILVVGDVMLDVYLWGKVDRVSPEAPVPVVACTHRESRLGGAANVALNLKSLGANPVLCSVIGKDDKGKDFLIEMEKAGLPTMGMQYDHSRVTTVKTRVISGSQHLLRVDDEVNHYLETTTEDSFIAFLQREIEKGCYTAIVFQDYDKGVITPRVIESVTVAAKEKKIPVTVDPKKRNYHLYRNVDLFKPNFKEFVEGQNVQVKKTDVEEIFQLTGIFLSSTSNKILLLTLSEEGVFVANRDGYWSIPAHKRDISDVSGAGDTVISVATLCLAAALSPLDMANIANLAGGLVCEKVGVVPVNRQQLFKECLALD